MNRYSGATRGGRQKRNKLKIRPLLLPRTLKSHSDRCDITLSPGAARPFTIVACPSNPTHVSDAFLTYAGMRRPCRFNAAGVE